jgi:cobalt-zinc-cadmium efflux system protein
MSHHHSHEHAKENNLLIATLLNLLITFVEIIGGLLSNSLSLLSDAFHNLGDTLATFLAYVAGRISKRNRSVSKTFGFRRIEIITAFLNATALIAICVFLFFEAYQRLTHPSPINGKLMMIIAVIGLIANLIAVIFLKKDSDKSLNIKAAYLHLLGDTFSSVGVIVASILIYYFKIYWIDALITFLIGLYIIHEAYEVFKQAYDILMQSTPEGIDLEEIKAAVEAEFEEIDNLHHLHAWNLTDRYIYFECHVDLKKDMKVSEAGPLRERLNKFLSERYNVYHLTVQFEYNCCLNKATIA